ncbi:ATP-binding protein [Paenibacillus sp. HB172176]|uniref:ATP-binding protein n=1 Tax=Paenibacillus sp. HB172176 TaxID=2493690 RepID=UPI00143933FB|nr:ATP-binding protein [Paenibacillus sp. HB172176]
MIMILTALLNPFQKATEVSNSIQLYSLFAPDKWEAVWSSLPAENGMQDKEGAMWRPLSEVLKEAASHRDRAGEVLWVRRPLPPQIDQITGPSELKFRGLSHYEVYLDDKLVLDRSMSHESRQSLMLTWNEVALPEHAEGLMLQLRIWPSDDDLEPIGHIYAGTQEDLLGTFLRIDAIRLILSICFLFMMVLAAGAWLFYERNRMYVYFAILTFAAGYSSLCNTSLFSIYLEMPGLAFYGGIGNPVVAWASSGIMERLAEERKSGGFRNLRKLFLALSLWSAISSIFAPRLYEQSMVYLFGVILLAAPYVLFTILRAFEHRRNEWKRLTTGMLLVLLCVSFDRLVFTFPKFNDLAFRYLPAPIYQLLNHIVLLSLFLLIFIIGIVLVIRARSQLHDYTSRLEEQNDQLQEVDRLKSEFLANTSHELRTPLHGIIGLTESLLDGQTVTMDEKAREHLSLVVSSGRRLARLIDDLLDLSKLNHRDINLELASVSMEHAVNSVLAVFQIIAAKKDITLHSEVDPDLPHAWADANRLQQILYNLIGNAVKYTDQGSITVRAQVTGRWIAVSIIDTGIGIAEEVLARLGQPFEQDGSVNRGGTGLGLSITRKLTELHGGHLALRSTQGQGTTCIFTLPVATEDVSNEEATMTNRPVIDPPAYVPANLDWNRSLEIGASIVAEGNHPAANYSEDAELAKLTVLIVDDEPVNLQVLESYLSALPIRIRKASTGATALADIEASPPDLILLDIMLPDLNGYEVCRLIRQRHDVHELPIVLLTARDRLTDLLEGFEVGANDYLTKPTARHELLARVRLQLRLIGLTTRLELLVQERTRELEQTTDRLRASVRERAEALAEVSVMMERTRISQDIHDHVGHTLTASIVQLEASIMLLDRGKELGIEKAKLAQSLVRKGLDEIRESVRMIRHEDRAFPMEAAMEQLLEETMETTGVSVTYSINSIPDLTSAQQRSLYQSLKEGLTNGIRHGQGTQFQFKLYTAEGYVTFELWNDGHPYTDSKVGFGLRAMVERVQELEGQLWLRSDEEEQGCLLTIHLPLLALE